MEMDLTKPVFYLIVAGGRDFTDQDYMVREIFTLMVNQLKDFKVEIIQGGARGADYHAKISAQRLRLDCHERKADWNKHGRSAGPIRNKEMADVAHGLLAFWDGESPGTKNMIETMKQQGKNVRIRYY